jgi:short-subunit dehydrogenase
VYAATKSALDGFARSLRIESNGNPFVQIIHIGAARTNMHTKLGISEQLNSERFPSAEWTAQQIAHALQTQKSEVTIGAVNKILRWAAWHFPTVLDSLAGRRA